MTTSNAWRGLATTQGVVYIGAGLWPLLHLRSFEAVTGPKMEGWLVKTVGLLIAAIGAALLVGRRGSDRSAAVLGATSAASLAAVDVVYASKKRISPVYLLDAALEIAFVAGWVAVTARRSVTADAE
jgi:hypothetical protein